MMKHPTLSPSEIEGLQQWCFDQDFQRLGPSIFRVLESQLLGYLKLKDSPNPILRQKAEHYAKDLRCAFPVFLAGRLFGPNATVRRWIGDLEQRLYAEFGKPTLAGRKDSVLAVGAAMWTWVTLKLDLFQHPKMIRTAYRIPAESWSESHLWEGIHHNNPIPGVAVQVEWQHARQQVWLRLSGALSSMHSESLGERLHESLAKSKSRLVLDLKDLHWDKVDNLAPLREKLAAYRSRISLVTPKLQAAHPELILLASMFHHYKG